MKYLMVVDSVNGTSTETAEYLKEELKDKIDIISVDEPAEKSVHYDKVLFIAGIYFSRWSERIKNRIKESASLMKDKETIYLLHGLLPFDRESFEKELKEEGVPLPSRIVFLGGRLDYYSQGILLRQIMRYVGKRDGIDPKGIDTLSEYEENLEQLVELLA